MKYLLLILLIACKNKVKEIPEWKIQMAKDSMERHDSYEWLKDHNTWEVKMVTLLRAQGYSYRKAYKYIDSITIEDHKNWEDKRWKGWHDRHVRVRDSLLKADGL